MTEPEPLTLSAADDARLREIFETLPDEAAALEHDVRHLLFQVLIPFEGRLWQEHEVEEVLGGLIEPIVSTAMEDSGGAWQQEIASLLTRHALGRARSDVVRWLLWAKRN
jgi:hypothetical protein